MEAVHVLDRVDRAQHGVRVDLARERELDEDPVDAVVAVELVEELEQRALRRVGREPAVDAAQAVRGRGLVLLPHVDVRSRVVADEHRREPDRAELGDIGAHLLPHPLGERRALHQHGRHGARLPRGLESPHA